MLACVDVLVGLHPARLSFARAPDGRANISTLRVVQKKPARIPRLLLRSMATDESAATAE